VRNRVGRETIIATVARGWESKSVEAQQADAQEKPVRPRSPLSAEEAARERAKETLRLARRQVQQQLETSAHPRHRKLLQDALAELEEKLSGLET